MNIMVAEDLYPESLPGDEPEPLPQVRWPLAQLMSLLDEEDFNEARNVSALFLVREWLQARADSERASTLSSNKKAPAGAFFVRTIRGFHRRRQSGWCPPLDCLLGGLGSFNKVLRPAIAPIRQLTGAAVDIHRDDTRRRS